MWSKSNMEGHLDQAKKDQEVTFLSEQFSLVKAVFLVSFKGINVEQMTTLRKSLSPFEARIKVVRNTLASLAVKKHPQMAEALKGQFKNDNALIFIYGDLQASAKFLRDFSQDIPHLQLKAGVLEGQLLDQAKILHLASLPSKQELQAKFLGLLQAPTQKFVGQLAAPLSQLLRIFAAHKDKNK